MAVPETDLHRIRLWARERVPEHLRDELKVEADVSDRHAEACTRVESAVHRPVNPTILTPEEFAASSGFLDNVRSGSAVAVIGELPWH